MQSDTSALRVFELSAEIVESLSTSQVDSQSVPSCGALVEWLVAIARDGLSRAEPPVRPPAVNPVRLSQVSWSPPGEPTGAETLSCAVQDGFALVRPARQGAGILLQARIAASPRFAALSAPALPRGELLPADDWYAALGAQGLEVAPAARVVDCVTLAGGVATAVLRPHPDDHASGFILGPRALDAALHLAFDYTRRATELSAGPRGLCPWPYIERVLVSGRGGVTRTVTLTTHSRGAAPLELQLSLFDANGQELARFERVTFVERRQRMARARGNLVRVFEHVVRTCLPKVELDATTDLTALGASSLDFVRIGAQAHELLGWTPPLATALAAPTLGGLADAYLSRECPTQLPERLATSDALSPTERQLWFLERNTNARGAYNEGCAFRIRGALSIDALDRALGHVQRNHPALRSYFPTRDGLPQRRLDWRQCQLELIESTPAIRDSPELLRLQLEDEICRPFDLERAPPFRCALLLHAAGDATLVVSAHHIVCDAWSFARVLVPELSAAYRAALAEDASLPPAVVPTELERRELGSDYEAHAAAFFRRTLDGVPHLLDFPFDRARPAVQTHRGACLRRRLPAVRWQAIKTLARELAHSPFVVGLAAYAILLQRYARSDQLCIGVPVSLRHETTDMRAFGCLVNVSALRVQLEPTLDFAGLCRAVKTDLIELLRFDQLALGDIVRAVAPARSLSHTPLVQAVFGLRELAGARLELGGPTALPEFVHNRRAKFDLTLTLDDYGDEAMLSLEYASDLLEPESAARILDHYEALFDELDRKPNLSLRALSLATRRERQQIAAYELGPVRPVIARELGLALLRHRPDDAVALQTHAGPWTIGRLRTHVGRVARALEATGVHCGELVAVCAPRSAEWVAAVLAILEVGAAYLPLDPQLPRERIERALADARVQVVVTLDGAFSPESPSYFRVVELRGLSTDPRWEESGLGASSPDPVYGILTSGSTGTPRIARVSHGGFANLLAFYLDALHLRATDRVLFATSVGFDLTQKNVFAALIAGAELVIDDADSFEPERIVSVIERCAITVFNCTPTLACALVAHATRDVRRLRSLRVLVLGGEPFDPSQLRTWIEHPSCHARILNTYGPTECTDVVTVAALARDVQRNAGTNLGKPIENARCRVVDTAGTVAGIGVPGELWLAGAPLGLGYVGSAADNSAKFVREHGSRWYRTGDLVRWNEAGELQYLGRLDLQVKLRGYRIELTEVETVLEAQPEVADAAVAIRHAGHGSAKLVGYVVPTSAREGSGPRPDISIALRRRLTRLLPSYMVPSAIVSVNALPRTASGKLDRNALREISAAETRVATTADPLLSRVAATVCEVLGLASVASEANFFEIGGHSLAAAQLADKLESELSVPIGVASLVARPTLRDFAAWLAEILEDQADADGQRLRVHGSRLPAT